jgi:RNA polymerase sigma-70 factor (ECF subfamily)
MALSQLRTKSRKPKEESLENFMEMESVDHLLEVEEKETLLLCLENCLNQLQGNQKRCISLFFLENKSYTEIQKITELDFKSVKTHLQNGKRMLRLLMEKQMNS